MRFPRTRHRTLGTAFLLGAALVAGVSGASSAGALPTPRPGDAATVSTPLHRAGASWKTKPSTKAPSRPKSPTTIDPAAAEVVRLVNVARADAGCAPLRVDSRLTTAARLHSEDMAARNYFSHTSLDGRSPWQRMEAQGYTAGSGENIAAGYTTAASVMTAWMNSSGHRANILNCSSKAIGVGIGKGGSYGTYWTQDFGYS
jgi:uncharacterized protein YkwD